MKRIMLILSILILSLIGGAALWLTYTDFSSAQRVLRMLHGFAMEEHNDKFDEVQTAYRGMYGNSMWETMVIARRKFIWIKSIVGMVCLAGAVLLLTQALRKGAFSNAAAAIFALGIVACLGIAIVDYLIPSLLIPLPEFAAIPDSNSSFQAANRELNNIGHLVLRTAHLAGAATFAAASFLTIRSRRENTSS